MTIPEAHWHGWSRAMNGYPDTSERRLALHIGVLPGRKQVALYIVDGEHGNLEPLAYFKSVALAEKALAMLDLLLG